MASNDEHAFDFITPDDLRDLRAAFNAVMKDHEEAHEWARLQMSREQFHNDFKEVE